MSKGSYVIRTNIDSLTTEQQDELYQNVVNAVNLLHKTVKVRKAREALNNFQTSSIIDD